MKTHAGKHTKRAIILWSILVLILAMAIAFAIYVSDFYRADSVALDVLQNDPTLEVRGNLTILNPVNANDSALIFYPGGKVEANAYLPLLAQIAKRGITCVLVEMPFNLAVLDINAADAVYAQFPHVRRWFIGGHSLGGAMAGSYASSHAERLSGLILLGAYRIGDFPSAQTLTIYGNLNTEVKNRVKDTKHVLEIPGGNHAQFGNYGPQRGDPPATISWQQQQSLAVDAIAAFVREQSID